MTSAGRSSPYWVAPRIVCKLGRGLSKRTLTGGGDPANATPIASPKVWRIHFQLRYQQGLDLITAGRSPTAAPAGGQSTVPKALRQTVPAEPV